MNNRRLTRREAAVVKWILNTAQSMAALKCVIGGVQSVINKTKWMLNRETIKQPHLAMPMWAGTQPRQLQGSITCVTLPCLDFVLEQIKIMLTLIQSFEKYFQESLRAAQMPRWIWETPFRHRQSYYLLIQFLGFFSVQISRSRSCWSQATGQSSSSFM